MQFRRIAGKSPQINFHFEQTTFSYDVTLIFADLFRSGFLFQAQLCTGVINGVIGVIRALD